MGRHPAECIIHVPCMAVQVRARPRAWAQSRASGSGLAGALANPQSLIMSYNLASFGYLLSLPQHAAPPITPRAALHSMAA